jgi:hypothetical protein
MESWSASGRLANEVRKACERHSGCLLLIMEHSTIVLPLRNKFETRVAKIGCVDFRTSPSPETKHCGVKMRDINLSPGIISGRAVFATFAGIAVTVAGAAGIMDPFWGTFLGLLLGCAGLLPQAAAISEVLAESGVKAPSLRAPIIAVILVIPVSMLVTVLFSLLVGSWPR